MHFDLFFQAIWHLPLALAGEAIAAPYLITTIISAVITNWVYYSANESALFAILYHTAANTMGLYLSPTFSGPDLVRLYWLLVIVNFAVAAMVVLLAGQSLRRHPHPKTALVAM